MTCQDTCISELILSKNSLFQAVQLLLWLSVADLREKWESLTPEKISHRRKVDRQVQANIKARFVFHFAPHSLAPRSSALVEAM
jgi:hypothetical protein